MARGVFPAVSVGLFVYQRTAAGNQEHCPRVGMITQPLGNDGVETLTHLLLRSPLRIGVAWRKRRCQQASRDEQQGDATHAGDILSVGAFLGAQETVPRNASPGDFFGLLTRFCVLLPKSGFSIITGLVSREWSKISNLSGIKY